MTQNKTNPDVTCIRNLKGWTKPLVAVLTVAWVILGGATAAQAQNCNASISQSLSFNTNLVVNDPNPPELTIELFNQNPSESVRFEHMEGGIPVPAQFFPNCIAVQTMPPDLNSPTLCSPLDDGTAGAARPFSLAPATLSWSEECEAGGVESVVAVPMNSALGQDRVDFEFRDAGNNPIALDLPGGETCRITARLNVDNSPLGFPADKSVLFVAGTEMTCLDSGLNNDALDSGGALFANPICGAEVDKQISCDGGLTWNDVDPNFGDGTSDPEGATGCTGWGSPSPPEVKVRYRAANLSINNPSGNDLTSCTLTDSNELVPAAPPIGTLAAFFDDFVGFGVSGTPVLECSEQFEFFEPNTATLDCICPGIPGQMAPISVSDEAEVECQVPAIEVTKTCEPQIQSGDPDYKYFVNVMNPANPNGATLENCVISDPGASCDLMMIPGPFVPGTGSGDIPCDSLSITNTATVTCEIQGSSDPQGQPKTLTDEATAECTPEEASVEVTKECASNNGDGTYTYNVEVTNPANPNGADLENCTLSDPNAACGALSQTSLMPGETATAECTGDSDMNMVTVTCDVVGAVLPDGSAKTVEAESMDGCVTLDKQVSCDGGLTWNDEGYNDAIAEGCTGWDNTNDPTIANEVVFRYLVRTGSAMTQCTLTESNPALGAVTMPADLAAKFDDEVFRTELLECNETTLEFEPDTARVDCVSVESGVAVTDSDDADLECVEPALQVSKQCTDDRDPQGNFVYTVMATNTGTAALVNCMLLDPGASCGPLSATSLGPTESTAATCTGINPTNTATVICEIEGAYQPPIGGCTGLGLSDDTVIDTRSHEACGVIDVGLDYMVMGPNGDLSLISGRSVSLHNGFSVARDGALSIWLDPALLGEPKTISATGSAACSDFEISKECEPQDASGDNRVLVTLTNTGGTDLTCDVTDPLVGQQVITVSLLAGTQQTIDFGAVTGLTEDTLNTATASCAPVGGQTIEKSGSDLCEVPECQLEVEKTCLVVPPPPTGFDCSDAKPIDVVSMIWGGTGSVDVRAWKGSVGSTNLGEFTGIDNGEEISVSGFAGSPNDVYWEVFAAGSNFNQKLGESKFHLSCSDSEMNGPEDCGNYAGNGKGDDNGFINDWVFEGLEGSGLVLDCTPTPSVPSDTCAASNNPVECTKRPTSLSLRITGGDCTTSMNTQDPSMTDCTDFLPIDPTQPVQIFAAKKVGDPPYLNMFEANVGDVVVLDPAVVGRSDLDAEMTWQIFQGGLAQEVQVHTSCSQGLFSGDKFGGFQIWSFENAQQGTVQFGVEVEYEYKITNDGSTDVVNIGVIDTPTPGEPFEVDGSPIDLLEPNDMVTLSSTQFLTETTANEVVVTGHAGSPGGNECVASDMAVVVFDNDFCEAMYWSDDFEDGNYEGGVGMWIGPWMENDPTGGDQDPGTGNVRIDGGDLRLDNFNYPNPDPAWYPSAWRTVNLSGKSSARLKFDWHLGWQVDDSDEVVVEISTDGVNFDILKSYGWYVGADNGWDEFDITQWISATTTVRFRISNKYGAEEEFFFVDFIEINGECEPQVCDETPVLTVWNGQVESNDNHGSSHHTEVSFDFRVEGEVDGEVQIFWRNGGSTYIKKSIPVSLVCEDGAYEGHLFWQSDAQSHHPGHGAEYFARLVIGGDVVESVLLN